ncbi:MAG: hypothetical protein ACLQVA_14565 [Candidatus Brocadiia bacterium]
MTPPMMPGSAIVPPLVRQRLPDLSGTAAKLAIALSGYVNGKTGDAFPSNKLLMRDAGITSWETFRHARKELAGCGLTWTAGKGDRLTVYRWNGVSPKIGESPIFGVSESPEIGVSDLTVQVTAQQEQPTSRHASHAGAKAKRGASGKTPGPPVWGWWVDANREAGPDPLRIGPDLGAARELGKAVTRGELTESELRGCLTLYLADDDAWLVKQGHALRHLAGRIGAYRAGAKELDAPPLDPALVDRIEAEAAEQERKNHAARLD